MEFGFNNLHPMTWSNPNATGHGVNHAATPLKMKPLKFTMVSNDAAQEGYRDRRKKRVDCPY